MIYVTTLMVNPFFGNWQRAEMMDGVVKRVKNISLILDIYMLKACNGMRLYSSSQRNRIYAYTGYYKD